MPLGIAISSAVCGRWPSVGAKDSKRWMLCTPAIALKPWPLSLEPSALRNEPPALKTEPSAWATPSTCLTLRSTAPGIGGGSSSPERSLLGDNATSVPLLDWTKMFSNDLLMVSVKM